MKAEDEGSKICCAKVLFLAVQGANSDQVTKDPNFCLTILALHQGPISNCQLPYEG